MKAVVLLWVSVSLGLWGGLPAQADGGVQLAADSSTEPQAQQTRELFLDVSASYFDVPSETMSGYAARYGAREDLTVLLFVATRTAQTPEQLHQLRLRGLFWWEISTMNELPGDVWFTNPEGEAAEETIYEPAFRELERWNRGETRNLEITDDDVRNLVAVRVIHDVFDLPVRQAMALRSAGEPLSTIVAKQYRLRSRGSEMTPAKRSEGNGPTPE